jgi:predicted Zn-dependent protease
MKRIALLCLIFAGLYSCGNVPVTGRRQLNLVSDSEILSLSLQQYNDYIRTAKLSTDRTATAMVTNVGSKIANAVTASYTYQGMESQLSNFSWEFNLIDDPQVNAFCMPGGKIVVYSGILPVTQNEAGLAVVIGHEVAHAIAKHANERMSQQMLAQFGAVGLGAIMSRSSSAAQSLGQTVFGLGAQYAVMMPYGRQQELEADHVGLILMAIAGYSPEVAVPFWEKMSQHGGSSIPEFLSTHPADATRIAGIRSKLPEAMEYYNSIWGNNSNTNNPATPPRNTTTNENWRF